MRKFTKEEFCAWLAEQGDRSFNRCDVANCAMTQFGKAIISGVIESRCHGDNDAPGLNGILFGQNREVLGHIDLTDGEIRGVITSLTFSEALQRITS